MSFDGFVGILKVSSSLSSLSLGGSPKSAPNFFRRASTANSNADLTFFFGSSGTSDFSDVVDDESSKSTFLFGIIGSGGFLIEVLNISPSSFSESLKPKGSFFDGGGNCWGGGLTGSLNVVSSPI